MRVKIEDVCDKATSNLKQSDVMNKKGLFPVFGAAGYLGKIDTFHQSKPYVAIVKDGAGIGRTMLLPAKSSVIGTMQYLLPKDIILPAYLYYVIKARHLEKYFSGATIPHIYFKDYKNEQFDLVNFEKQKQIVHKLKVIEKIMTNLNDELKLFDELIKARFVEMFGDPKINPFNWTVVNISKVLGGKVLNGFFAKRDAYVDNGNVSILGVANVVNRMYSKIDKLPRINADKKDIEKFEVKYGDMLFCRSSLVAEGIGKASIVPENLQDKVLFECHVIRVPLDLNQCVPEFLQTLSTMDYFRNQVISNSKTATMTTIGQDGILKTKIILPPMEKQREFYCFIKQIDKSKFEVQKSLEKTQQLYDSLMQKYFG